MPRKVYTKKPRRKGRRMARRRLPLARTLGSRGRYADVKSFKLKGQSQLVYTTLQAGIPNVSTVGGGIGIGNLGFSANKASFSGVEVFTFNNVYQLQQLNTLFDRYKIHGVALKFIPEWNVADVTGQGIIPTMKVIHDYDDANINDSANTVGSIWARQGREFRLTRPFTMFVKPKVANMIYRSTLSTAYATLKAPYINMSTTDVPHYGLKFAVKDWYAPTSQTVNFRLRIEPTYYVTLREQLCPNAPDVGIPLAEDGTEAHTNTELEQNPDMSDTIPCEVKPPPS